LDAVPLWLLFAATCVLVGAAVEGGYRLGRWRHVRAEGEKEAPVGAMVGSILALFAFMLAFTFGLAATRFEARRQAVLDEANAVGTTYLRAQLLRDERQRAESIRLLREYVDVRVRGVQEGKVEEAIARSEQLHDSLWAEARKAAASDPTPITGLYVQSLNETIDLHAGRVHAAVRSRIPPSIWAGLMALAVLSMASVGYQAGLSVTRRSPAMLGLVLAFSGVLFLIADLDRPREGFLVVSQQAMLDVQKSMNAGPP
jgi:hypothetical protein